MPNILRTMRRSTLLFSVPNTHLLLNCQSTARTGAPRELQLLKKKDTVRRVAAGRGREGGRDGGREGGREGGHLNKVLKITSCGREEERDEEEKNER